MKSLTIRIPDEEHALMQAAAAKRFMTITGMVRAHFHSIFEADGTLPDQQQPAEPSKPRVNWRPIPQGTNVWAYEIHARRTAGESFADIAESYGTDLETIKRKFKFADEEIALGAPAPAGAPIEQPGQPEPEPELVYDPVDPDNPTEEEQAINAEIARRRMTALGFKL